MTVKLRCVHTLDAGNACLVFSLVLDTSAVLEDIHTLGQIVHEKVCGGVTRALIVAQAILISVAAGNIDRLGTAASLVFKVNVFHITVNAQFDAYDQFVAHGKRILDRIKHLALVGCVFDVQGLNEL